MWEEWSRGCGGWQDAHTLQHEVLCRLTAGGGTPTGLVEGGVREESPACGTPVGLPSTPAASPVLVLAAVCTGERELLAEKNLRAGVQGEGRGEEGRGGEGRGGKGRRGNGS